MFSNVKSSITSAASCFVKSAANCVPEFGGKTLLIGSTVIAAGIGGYLLWHKAIKPYASRRCQSSPCLQFDPEYVLPSNAKWYEVVEEEERRNPEFGKDVYIDPLYRIDSGLNVVTTDSSYNIFADADEDLGGNEEGVEEY